MVKRRRDWGRERKRHDGGNFIVFWISIPKKRKFLIGWLLVNLSTKNLSLEGAQLPLWLKHLQNMVNKHGSRTALQCSKTSLCFCGTWNIFSTKYNLFFAPSKFPYTTARDQWQILQYCDASWPFSLCFLLTLRNPLFSECFGIHYHTIIAIPNAPKPNSRKWTSCFFKGKSTQNDVNCQKGRNCQLKRHKKRQSTRSKMPLQSLIFSSSCTLSIYCGSKEKQETARSQFVMFGCLIWSSCNPKTSLHVIVHSRCLKGKDKVEMWLVISSLFGLFSPFPSLWDSSRTIMRSSVRSSSNNIPQLCAHLL